MINNKKMTSSSLLTGNYNFKAICEGREKHRRKQNDSYPTLCAI